ncbi:SPFH domain-containing protein [Nocardia sp. NBC_01503]|uniref:SPFH domain-containing protein n=1 Tax=Nocardia sp. NBC_01503 TaxID=2975997 RepID=UPI002E7B6911|nr:SPFH domain-containing protein [Nocardia sp. NBC_01503]WTL29926.1 SPFH domain-containing protein [Nocardia sp. NBC_01503]
MAWFEREFIAVPEDRKHQLVYKWPDLNIRRYSRALVNADEIALFVRSGKIIAALGPGRHRIDADELPVLGALVDTLTGGNFYRAELYFVSARELPGIKFGGRLTDIADPVSEQVVTLRAFGEFALSVRDPGELITGLIGTVDPADPDAASRWCAALLLKCMKIAVAQGVSRGEWPVLGLSGQLAQIESTVLRETNILLYEYGLRVPRMGNFDITLASEDAERLKRLAKDRTYVRMTGDFGRYAAGEMAIGAGQGMARGGGDIGFLGAALGLNTLQQQTVAPPLPAISPVCPSCHSVRSPGARFCGDCGTELAPRPACRNCATELRDSAKFCGNCGTIRQ